MRSPRIDIASIRKEQIVEAAVAVISEQGLHNLSLSEIETRAGMSRGQLTYYFHTKEDILLSVFDRVVQLMYERMGRPEETTPERPCLPGAWDIIGYLFTTLLTKPPVSPEFHTLQYTFLSQIAYREDFRKRLAALYEEWRSNMSRGLAEDQASGKVRRPVAPRAMATLIQAMLHGLTLQAAADPQAFDGEEMRQLCLDVLRTYLGVKDGSLKPGKAAKQKASMTAKTRRARNGVSPTSRG
jgi:AcrR family transcriptional regulator